MTADLNQPVTEDLLDRLRPDEPLPACADPEERQFLSDYQFVARATASFRAIARAASGCIPLDDREPPRLAGYAILDPIGEGGFGHVWLARQEALGRLVAVKVLQGELTPEQRERFDREREALARLNNPNILAVIDAGQTDKGQLHLVLEYAVGGDLRRYAPFPWPAAAAARTAETLARAVHAAHQLDIVHRDLKPANILVQLPAGAVAETATGELPEGAFLKIADFGLARFLPGPDNSTAAEDAVTRSGTILGTCSYMAPEQARGQAYLADARADVWSLGVILYELLTGRLPFQGADRWETLRQVTGPADPPAPRLLRKEIPKEIERVCLAALRKEPGERWPTAAVFADALARAVAGEAPPLPPRRRRRLRLVGALLAATLAALVVIAAVFLLTNGKHESVFRPEPAAPAPPLSAVAVLKLVRADIEAAGLADPDPARWRLYLFAPHLAPAGGLSAEEQAGYRTAIAALGQHLRPGDAPLFRPLDPDRTVFALDAPAGAIRPPKLLSGYPYGLTFEASETGRLEDAFIQSHVGQVSFVRLDWFLRRADQRLNARESLFGVGEPAPQTVAAWVRSWEKRPVDLATAAVELGTSPDQVRLALRTNPHLSGSYGMAPLLTGGTVSRAAWESTTFSTSAFQELARVLGRGTPVRVE